MNFYQEMFLNHQIKNLNSIVHIAGKWCTYTRYKTETILYDTKIVKQKTFDWCKNKRCLLFDFFIKEYKLIIELDRRQHFEQIANLYNGCL